MMQPRIILLREGTDTSQGKGQLISNINAVEAVCDILKSTLGPRGMDKLIHEGNRVTISNDGATIISLLDIVHPAAKSLVDIARSQDAEVGDGTTSVCLLAGSMLKNVKVFVEDGMHPQIIMAGYRKALEVAIKKLREMSIKFDPNDKEKTREMLLRCAGTALNSKLISGQKEFFSDMIVDAVSVLGESMDLKMIGIKKVAGGSVTDSCLVNGVAFKKTFAYAGFEQQPKSFTNPKIVLLNLELELKNERQNAEVRIEDPEEYQSIVDAEWKIIYNKLDKLVDSGAQIVLSRLPIGDLATQYFADRNIFCAGRLGAPDVERVQRATGAVIQTSLSDLSEDILGTCEKFYEQQVGAERFNFFEGCPKASTATMILRGGAEQFIAESERSIHDALMIVKRASQHKAIVPGGGAVEMELSRHLREYSSGLTDKRQLIVAAFARALEVVPRQVSENAGFDSTDIMNQLRAAHSKPGGEHMGVDVDKESVCNTFETFVWEPTLVKLNALSAACEAACLILSVDETVKNPKAQNEDNRPAQAPQRGRGMRR